LRLRLLAEEQVVAALEPGVEVVARAARAEEPEPAGRFAGEERVP